MKRQVWLGCVGSTDCAITRHYSFSRSITAQAMRAVLFASANGYDQRRSPPTQSDHPRFGFGCFTAAGLKIALLPWMVVTDGGLMLRSLPRRHPNISVAQDPAHVFARDLGRRSKVALVDLMAD
jgi:hypothetical protein